MARRKYKELGYYAVVTYGPEGKWTSPWYLKRGAKVSDPTLKGRACG